MRICAAGEEPQGVNPAWEGSASRPDRGSGDTMAGHGRYGNAGAPHRGRASAGSGAVGDALTFLPSLIEEIESRRG